jgi:hypothetical protein
VQVELAEQATPLIMDDAMLSLEPATLNGIHGSPRGDRTCSTDSSFVRRPRDRRSGFNGTSIQTRCTATRRLRPETESEKEVMERQIGSSTTLVSITLSDTGISLP